jgi:hypothetical protein
MKQIFVVGPSGVGRTTLCKEVSEIERSIVHVSFDEELKLLIDAHYPMPQKRSGEEGREFWRFCLGVINNLSNQLHTDITLLFDVDAGAEYIPECQEYLIERAENLICLTGSPDEVYKREVMRAAEHGNPPRPKEEFMDTEFSPAIQRLFDAAAITINITHEDSDTALEKFRGAVKELAEK